MASTVTESSAGRVGPSEVNPTVSSVNAVKTQVWTAISVYVMVAILKDGPPSTALSSPRFGLPSCTAPRLPAAPVACGLRAQDSRRSTAGLAPCTGASCCLKCPAIAYPRRKQRPLSLPANFHKGTSIAKSLPMVGGILRRVSDGIHRNTNSPKPWWFQALV